MDRDDGWRWPGAQHRVNHCRDRGAVGLPIARASGFDLSGINSRVTGDDMTVRKPHDEGGIVSAAIGIDEEARKPRQNRGSPKNTGQMAGDPGGANIVGDVTGELFLGQTEGAIGAWQRVSRVIAKKEDARRKVSLDFFDGIFRAHRGNSHGPLHVFFLLEKEMISTLSWVC